jgi:hypothetical protein
MARPPSACENPSYASLLDFGNHNKLKITLHANLKKRENNPSVVISSRSDDFFDFGVTDCQSKAISVVSYTVGVLDISEEIGDLLRKIPLCKCSFNTVCVSFLDVFCNLRSNIINIGAIIIRERSLHALNLASQ